jgi:mono/diheme cytochrome c family protein
MNIELHHRKTKTVGKHVSVVTGLLFSALSFLAINSLAFAQDTVIKNITPSPESRTSEKLFTDYCAYCHGFYIAPGVSVAPELRSKTFAPELIKVYVRNGLGPMIALPYTDITDQELEELAVWLKTAPVPSNPLRGGPQ